MTEMEFIIAHRANLLAIAKAVRPFLRTGHLDNETKKMAKTIYDAILSDVRLIEKRYNIQPEKGNGNDRNSSPQHYQTQSRENSPESN